MSKQEINKDNNFVKRGENSDSNKIIHNKYDERIIVQKKYEIEKIKVLNFFNQFAEKNLKIIKNERIEILNIAHKKQLSIESINFEIIKFEKNHNLQIQNLCNIEILVQNNPKLENSLLLIKPISDNQIKQEIKIIKKTESELNEKKDEMKLINNNTNRSNCQTEYQQNYLPFPTVFNTYIPQNYGITDNHGSHINKFNTINFTNFLESNSLVDNRFKNDDYIEFKMDIINDGKYYLI